MHATVIDTLRYADRLKEAGLDPGQAEAMSRALNDELTEGLVTKPDLDAAVSLLKTDLDDRIAWLKGELDDGISGLKGELDDGITGLKGDLDDRIAPLERDIGKLGGVVSELKLDVGNLGARVDTLEATVDAGFKAVDDRFKAVDDRFKAVDDRFKSMDGKFEAVDAKFRYVFLVLALIVALGLYNAVSPHVLGTMRSDSQPAEPAPASLPAQTPAVDANAAPADRGSAAVNAAR